MSRRYIEAQIVPERRLCFEVRARNGSGPIVGVAEVMIEDLARKREWNLLLQDTSDSSEAIYGTDLARPSEEKCLGYRRPTFLQIRCCVTGYGSPHDPEAMDAPTKPGHHVPGGGVRKALAPKGRPRAMIVTRGTRGDVQPFVALARGLAVHHKCEVIVVTEICWRKFVLSVNAQLPEGSGSIHFRPTGGNTTKLTQQGIGRIWLENSAHFDLFQAISLGLSEWNFFASEGTTFHWAWEERPDFIVFGFTMVSIAMLISEALHIPIAGFFLQPDKGIAEQAVDVSEDEVFRFDDVWAPMRKVLDSEEFQSTFMQLAERMPSAGDVRGIRSYRQQRGLRSGTIQIREHDVVNAELRKQRIPIIVPISEVVLKEQAVKLKTRNENIVLTTFIFLRMPGAADRLPDDIESFIQAARRANRQLIVMAFSSMPVGERNMIRAALDIAEFCCPQRADGETARPAVIVMAAGQGFDPVTEDSHPELFDKAMRFQDEGRLLWRRTGAPFGALFPRMDAAILQGGAGTTSEAMSVGLPIITSGPLLMDQRYWAARCNSLGNGSAGIKTIDLCAKKHGEDNAGTAAKMCERLLDTRPDNPESWYDGAKRLQQEMIDAGCGPANDGCQDNARVIFESAYGPNAKCIEDAFADRRGVGMCLLCQFLLCLKLGACTARWCFCHQLPACFLCWLRLIRFFACCSPCRTLYAQLAKKSNDTENARPMLAPQTTKRFDLLDMQNDNLDALNEDMARF